MILWSIIIAEVATQMREKIGTLTSTHSSYKTVIHAD